jgi:hypothetical protein
MEPIEVNSRVALILKLDDNKRNCYFLGYGIYEGKFVPDIGVLKRIYNKKRRRMIETSIKDGKENCRFILDEGQILYDFDCWMMEEERFKVVFIDDVYDEGWKVININIYGKRRKV